MFCLDFLDNSCDNYEKEAMTTESVYFSLCDGADNIDVDYEEKDETDAGNDNDGNDTEVLTC